jgi:hypothetical protein
MITQYRRSPFRSKLEGVFAGVVFAATSVLFVGGIIAECLKSGLVA